MFAYVYHARRIHAKLATLEEACIGAQIAYFFAAYGFSALKNRASNAGNGRQSPGPFW